MSGVDHLRVESGAAEPILVALSDFRRALEVFAEPSGSIGQRVDLVGVDFGSDVVEQAQRSSIAVHSARARVLVEHVQALERTVKDVILGLGEVDYLLARDRTKLSSDTTVPYGSRPAGF